MEHLSGWWGERSSREHWMLGVMFALIGATLLWFAILQPLWAAGDAAAQAFDRASKARGEVAATAAALKAASNDKVETLSGTVDGAAGAAALAAGFTLSSISPQGDGSVNVAIPAVKAPTLWRWAGELAQRGVVIDRMTVRNSGDGSLAVEATVRGPR